MKPNGGGHLAPSIFTYAKAEHDRCEHEDQERKLNADSALLLSANDKASTLLADMSKVNESLKKSDGRGAVTARGGSSEPELV